jgi:hypothetical protein
MNEPVYNCGCFWWMHGTKDACDLYLPERKPARRECPIVTEYRAALERRLADVMRQQAEAVMHEEVVRVQFLANMPECNRRRYETATGAAMAKEQYLANAYGQRGGLLQGILGLSFKL